MIDFTPIAIIMLGFMHLFFVFMFFYKVQSMKKDILLLVEHRTAFISARVKTMERERESDRLLANHFSDEVDKSLDKMGERVFVLESRFTVADEVLSTLRKPAKKQKNTAKKKK